MKASKVVLTVALGIALMVAVDSVREAVLRMSVPYFMAAPAQNSVI